MGACKVPSASPLIVQVIDQGLRCPYCECRAMSCSVYYRVSKPQPGSQIWLTTCTRMASELGIVLHFLNVWKNIKRRTYHDTWILQEIQVSVAMNKVSLEHSYSCLFICCYVLQRHMWVVATKTILAPTAWTIFYLAFSHCSGDRPGLLSMDKFSSEGKLNIS